MLNEMGLVRVYRFGVEANGNSLLGEGWGEPEQGFVWSEKKFCKATVPAPAGAVSLSISLWGYNPPGAEDQEVLLFIDGSLKSCFCVRDKEIYVVNSEVSKFDSHRELMFYIPNATSPRQAEDLPDDRRLGVALAAIMVNDAA